MKLVDCSYDRQWRQWQDRCHFAADNEVPYCSWAPPSPRLVHIGKPQPIREPRDSDWEGPFLHVGIGSYWLVCGYDPAGEWAPNGIETL